MNIILCADDFGRSMNRNLAIDFAFKHNMIKSAGLIVSSKYTYEAVSLASTNGYLRDIHLHLCLDSNGEISGGARPLSEKFRKDPHFCTNNMFSDVNYYRIDFYRYVSLFYDELEKQYLEFKKITKGKANLQHIDFHIYRNLSFPVGIAYRKLIKNYRIKSARYIGLHQLDRPIGGGYHGMKKYFAHALISRQLNGKKGEIVPSCTIGYFMKNRDKLKKCDCIELYCHPDLIDGKLVDNTKNSFDSNISFLENNYNEVAASIADNCFVSWRAYVDGLVT